MTEQQGTYAYSGKKITAIVFAAVFLLVANSAFWFTRYIFNVNNFTSIASPAITSESSREAVASEITARMLEARPVLLNIIDDPTEKMIAGLLHSSVAQNSVEKVVTTLQTNLTSSNPGPIGINLAPLKSRLINLVSVANQVGVEPSSPPPITVDEIPDFIVLVPASELPNIYTLGKTLQVVGPIALLVSIFLLGLVLFWSRHSLVVFGKTLLLSGIAVAVAGLVSFLIGPIFKPQFLGQINNSSVRVVAENVYNAFLQTFNSQAWWLFGLGLVFGLIAVGLLFVSKRMRT